MDNMGYDIDNKIIIATIKAWNIKEAKDFILDNKDENIYLITEKDDLTYEKVSKINPKYIYFPHWSWKIPKEIFNEFDCVIFHMTNLPFGKGGSPLQNLILRGIGKTKISAIKATEDLDSGPIYLKKELSLDGSAEEIFRKAAKIIFKEMIPYITKHDFKPSPQKGQSVVFPRRKPEESNMKKINDLKKIYDHIRMLDAEGYPKAFIETDDLIIEFSDAEFDKDLVTAKAKIKIKGVKK